MTLILTPEERINILERQVKMLFGLLIDNMEDVNNVARDTEVELENLSAGQLDTISDVRLLHRFKPLVEESEPEQRGASWTPEFEDADGI
jgi:hypothetical protein